MENSTYCWLADDQERILPFANITRDQIEGKQAKKGSAFDDFVVEHIHEFADHHLTDKSAQPGKIYFHSAKHSYVAAKDTSSDQFKCEVLESHEEVIIPKKELSSSILLTIRVTDQKEEEKDSFL